jgi:dTDP-4-dehydrorhamnose reductase
MRVLIIGARGQLGTDCCRVFEDCDLHRADREGASIALDLADAARVREVVGDLQPEVVLNTAAAHNVPACETDPALAFAVNASGVFHLARACAETRARLVHISTDYVFGDTHAAPIGEGALPAPLNVYAASKLAGEHLALANCADTLVVRSAALYGAAPCLAKGGMNFVRLMLHLAATRPEIRVVTDEITTPTYTLALAQQLRLLAERGRPGLYHATCQGQCSWHEFARAIFAKTNTPANLLEATCADFPSPVRRPKYSVLDNAFARAQSLDIMPAWESALDAYLAAL